jgi:2-methylcitrate dehydratase MmgE/PrpD-like protein
VERLGAFAANASFDQLSEAAVEALKLRVLDSLGTALGALDAEPVALVRRQVEDFGGAPHCGLIGGGRSAPDRAALLNGALVRYLDFNDAYLALERQRRAGAGRVRVRGRRRSRLPYPNGDDNMTAHDTLTREPPAFPFLASAQRPGKPRTRGVTEIRGPYYSVMGPRYLEDVLDTMVSTWTR